MKKFTNNKLTQFSLNPLNLYKMYRQPAKTRALSAFQKQFKKVQGVKSYYSISSKYIEASVLETILKIERRLDVVLTRMNLVSSIYEGRQKIRHNKVYVNEILVKAINYFIKPGDIIEIRDQESNNEWIKHEVLGSVLNYPSNMEVNQEIQTGKYIRDAKIEEVNIPVKIK